MALKRVSLFLLAAALLSAAGLARLGVWQLRRASEKEALQTAITAQTGLPVMSSNAELVASAPNAEGAGALLHRRVKLRGQWQPAHTVYLDNRPMSGRVGFIVVTPLKLEGFDEAITVQRGWVPRDASDRTHLMPVSTPEGPVDIEGRLASEPSAVLEIGADDDTPGRIRQNLQLAAYEREVGLRLLRLSLLQQAPPGVDELARDWPSPVVNVQKHYGYAFQWFAMSALVVGLYVWFQLIRPFLRSR